MSCSLRKSFSKRTGPTSRARFHRGVHLPLGLTSFSCIEEEWLYPLVVDYRRLNLVTAPDPYCMPRIEPVLERMSRAYIFSTVDLAKGFYQVPVHSPHIPKTTFITEHGKFTFSVMSFGLLRLSKDSWM